MSEKKETAKKTQLTYRTIQSCKETLIKLLNSAEIQDVDTALEIACVRKDLDTVIEKYSKGYNSIAFKYAKKAEKREITEEEAEKLGCKPIPGGYNTAEEQEGKMTEIEEFLNRPVGMYIDFPVIPKNEWKELYRKSTKDKKENPEKGVFVFTMTDISSLMMLGMIEKK